MSDPPFTLALIAGGCAGTSVDVALHPLDTFRTRLQSAEGFFASGGFKGAYKGLFSAALGSAPGAAMFFSTYETAKKITKSFAGDREHWTQHAGASSAGEVMACLVRVPTAVITQNMQVGRYATFNEAVSSTMKNGGIGAFYKGYGTTVLREIPFSFIQFPIYEQFKKTWASYQGYETNPVQGAMCGSVAGAIAGGLTTPLDCAKTRIMLEAGSKAVQDGAAPRYTGTLTTLKIIHAEEGIKGLFKGLSTRVTWITIGGFIFFGGYEGAQKALWKTGVW
jgi:solute carrier family 25 S-adenosylmethionine transporter 26